jgi:DNA-binding MarR family transcriptional regulator
VSISTVDGLAQLSFVVQAALERCAAEHDISVQQVRLCGVLRDRKPTMNELAKLLGLDKSSVSGLVDRAERRGLVERVPSATDRRATTVSLSIFGRKLVVEVAGRFEAEMTALVNGLDAGQRGTLTYLVSQVLVAHAAAHGVDLFDTVASS